MRPNVARSGDQAARTVLQPIRPERAVAPVGGFGIRGSMEQETGLRSHEFCRSSIRPSASPTPAEPAAAAAEQGIGHHPPPPDQGPMPPEPGEPVPKPPPETPHPEPPPAPIVGSVEQHGVSQHQQEIPNDLAYRRNRPLLAKNFPQ